MSSLGMFSAAEVYDMAVTTEQNGRAFYEAAAAAATSEGVARLMRDLAVAEANHEQTFRQMRQASSGHAPRESYEGENAEYVTALLFSRVLPDAETGVKAVAAMTDDVEAGLAAISPYSALYVGGMGSKQQNFYNQLAIRMGFAEEAAVVQELYLAGRHRDAAAAVPRGVAASNVLAGKRHHAACAPPPLPTVATKK